MQNLALHCQDKEHDPIAEQYWPEDGNVEYREECHDKSNTEGFCDGIPENSSSWLVCFLYICTAYSITDKQWPLNS
jgi:hypothetical protein